MKKHYLDEFIIEMQSKGKYSFTLQDVRATFSVSRNALNQALKRLVKNRRICSVKRNFYIIIPPEYKNQGIVPPALFIDDLMKRSNKQYYVGLLSAAGFHGSSHQQPQEFFVITQKPAMRKISVRSVNINFIVRKEIINDLIFQSETQTGYISVSGPVLTALDCILSSERIGGIGRAYEVIRELAPAFSRRELKSLLHRNISIPVIQRLGTLLDYDEDTKIYADILFKKCDPTVLRKAVLSPAYPETHSQTNRWNVIENRNKLPRVY
jgi:predicted transcriptional regulator of viral defense system